MKKSFILFLCIVPALLCPQTLSMKQIVFLPEGLMGPDNILCGETNHNGYNEIIFSKCIISTPSRKVWEIWECRPINRYELVFADTGPPYYPPGIYTGNFYTEYIGDVDRDSLADLLGKNQDKPTFDTTYYVISTQESPNNSAYPSSLSWWFRYGNNFGTGEADASFYFTPDLDNDNKYEIIAATPSSVIGEAIWENVANNQNQLVWNDTSHAIDAFNYTFGDFDLDGSKEFVTAELGSRGRVFIRENTGENQYELIRIDTVGIPNGHDVFSGNDVDGDGHPEFFIRFARVGWTFYLYMWEATGNNTYQRALIDQVARPRFDPGDMRSKCGDIDGDSIEEIVWSIASDVFVYKATGNNQFQVVWHWIYPGPNDDYQAVVNIYDMNENGYNEIVISGNDTTRIFEVEAVRILRPNGGETFHADSNELIQWQKFYPPRCDSLSLFYSIDNGRTYQSIVHSLQSTDTSYLWTVPNVNSDSCKIKIIAYGPGWQYDESDGIFRITTTGIEERSTLEALHLTLRVTPNPAKSSFTVRIPLSACRRQSGFGTSATNRSNLKLFDISGKLVKEIALLKPETKVSLNDISTGIYFLTLETEQKRIIERLVIIK